MWMYVEGAFDGANKGPFRLCRQGPTYVLMHKFLGSSLFGSLYSFWRRTKQPSFLPASSFEKSCGKSVNVVPTVSLYQRTLPPQEPQSADTGSSSSSSIHDEPLEDGAAPSFKFDGTAFSFFSSRRWWAWRVFRHK